MMRRLVTPFGGQVDGGDGQTGPSPSALTIEPVPTSDTERFLEQHAQRLMQAFVDIVAARQNELRDALNKSYADVDESLSLYNVTILDVPAQSNNFERITDVVAYCGPAAGLLTLGSFQVVIPAATWVSIGMKKRLSNTDRRRLSSVTLTSGTPNADGSGAAGFIALALFGQEIPTGAMMW